MRYVIVDLEGASRDYFATRGAVREALREIEAAAPGTTAELYVVTYDDDDVRRGDAERGDEMIAHPVVLFLPRLDWREAGGSAADEDAPPTTVVSGASR